MDLLPYHLTKLNATTYQLTIKGEHGGSLFYPIQKLLPTAFFNDGDGIVFTADKVEPLSLPLSHQSCVKLIHDVSQQLYYLEKIRLGFYGLNWTDVLVIDQTYLLVSAQYLQPLEDVGQQKAFVFMSPIRSSQFGNPETTTTTTSSSSSVVRLPLTVSPSCFYYSLGSLILYALLGINPMESGKEEELLRSSVPITKIYWFLMRCFTERQWLLI